MPNYMYNCTILPEIAISGLAELPALLLKLTVELNEAPLFIDLLYRISGFADVISSQTIFTLLPDTAISRSNNSPASLLKFTVVGS